MLAAWIYIKLLALMTLPFVLLYLSHRKKTKHPGCGHCGYNLAGARESLVCPECGGQLLQVGIIPAGTTQRNGLLSGLGILAFLIIFGPVVLALALVLFISLAMR